MLEGLMGERHSMILENSEIKVSKRFVIALKYIFNLSPLHNQFL